MPRRCCRWGALLCLGAVCWQIATEVRAESPLLPTVGVTTEMRQVVLPGSELEARPLDDRNTPIVLRIVKVSPHDNGCCYDFEWYGLVPGKYDLRDYLRRKDGSKTADLPSVPVEVAPLLPKGQVLPNDLKMNAMPPLGGYRLLLLIGVIVWILGLLVIVFFGRGRKKQHQAVTAPSPTVADRLRPLVERAVAGRLTLVERAELERTLLAFWRRRLGLENTRPSQALDALRRHPEAGLLLEQLEIWLHRPGPAVDVDVAVLLRPYQNVPQEAPALAATAS